MCVWPYIIDWVMSWPRWAIEGATWGIILLVAVVWCLFVDGPNEYSKDSRNKRRR